MPTWRRSSYRTPSPTSGKGRHRSTQIGGVSRPGYTESPATGASIWPAGDGSDASSPGRPSYERSLVARSPRQAWMAGTWPGRSRVFRGAPGGPDPRVLRGTLSARDLPTDWRPARNDQEPDHGRSEEAPPEPAEPWSGGGPTWLRIASKNSSAPTFWAS